MPAIVDLYDFETPIENGVKAVLVAGLPSLVPTWTSPNITSTRDDTTNPTPRAEVNFETGPALGQWTAAGQSSNPRQVPAAYSGTLMITIATTRPIDGGLMDPLHPQIRGAIRYLLSAGAKAFIGIDLGGLQLLEVLPSQTQSGRQENKEQDLTILTWSVKFGIPQAAWPAT